MANGSESGEFVVSSIRTGMKREFAMMMKAQAECAMMMGQRRVTRSQNGALSNGYSRSTRSEKRAASSEVKRRRREPRTPSQKRVKAAPSMEEAQESMQGNAKLEKHEEVVANCEEIAGAPQKVNVNSDEEEPKSDVVDGSSDDERKDQMVESGVKESKSCADGNEERSEQQPQSDKVINSSRCDMDLVGSGALNDTRTALVEAINEEPKDGIVEAMPEELQGLIDGFNVDVTAACGIDNVDTSSPTLANGSPEKPFRRFTRSALKLKEKVIEAQSAPECVMSGEVLESKNEKQEIADDAAEPICKRLPEIVVPGIKDEVESPVTAERTRDNAFSEKPFRRFTRSALKLKEEPLVASGSEGGKDKEVVECHGLSTACSTSETQVARKVEIKKTPSKLKELLDTGLLEGLSVRYIRGAKVREHPEAGLKGTIRGSGILCFCEECKGTSPVLSPNQFELHAGSTNKRPPEYIYLENGNTLRDVLNACKDAPAHSLESAILSAAGSAHGTKVAFCLTCRGSIPENGIGRARLLCNSCTTLEESQPSAPPVTQNSNRPPSVPVTKSTNRVSATGGPKNKPQGRLTRKDLRMHRLVFEDDVLPDGAELNYFVRGKKLREGYKKGSGIFCYCCNSEVSPSQFEAHAGCASRRKPYLNIYTSNGVSLHELSIRLSQERRSSSAEENDDLCSICSDGGDLLCCDNCPRAFHKECVSLPSIPQGKWYCRYCQNMFQKEKFVERNANAIAAGRVAGIDPLEQITQRCIRIVETLEPEIGGCTLCRSLDFSKSGFGPRTVIICDQCEKEYHVGCLKEHKMDDLQELPTDKWFCCTDCRIIHFALEDFVLEGERKVPVKFLNNLKMSSEEMGLENSNTPEVTWRILSGRLSSEETRTLFSSAVSIYHDQFDPISDSSTSRLDLIPHMVYGRNFKDQDFGGMYCAVLIVNSLPVSSGIFRIFGKEVAELPLVATSAKCQGKGYFRALFSCFEALLALLNVKTIVLPAADEAAAMWTNKFGFEKISPEQLKEYRKQHPLMIFQGTSMLHKAVDYQILQSE